MLIKVGVGSVGVAVRKAIAAVFPILHKGIDHPGRFSHRLWRQVFPEFLDLTNNSAVFFRSKVEAAFEVIVEISCLVVCILPMELSVHCPAQ